MRLILLIALLLSATQLGHTQTAPTKKQVKKAVKAVKKGECILIYYTEMLASTFEKKQIEHLKVLFELDANAVNDLFFKEKNVQLRLTLFYILCSKYRSEITEKHFDALKGNQPITLCSGANSQAEPLDEIVAYFYDSSVPRKEKIINTEAQELVNEAQNLWYAGPVDFEKMISLLNAANSLEPNNPIILEARGDALFNSQIDIERGMEDYQNAITYSQDEKALEIRYNNRGLTYMSMGKMELACEDWSKGGQYSTEYVEQYCAGNLDTTFVITAKLLNDTAYLSYSNDPPEMSVCKIQVNVKNNGTVDYTGKGKLPAIGRENEENDLFLEAMNETGGKVEFPRLSLYDTFNDISTFSLKPGTAFTTEFYINYFFPLPEPGIYQIRLVLRPTENSSGLQHKYYSNWETLVVENK